MEPHRVVEAGHLQTTVRPIETVREHGGVEQRHVARICDDARVQCGIVGESTVGAQPDRLVHGGNPRARHRVTLHVTNVYGAGPFVPFTQQVFVRCHARLEVGQGVGGRNLGHVDLVRETLLGGVEAGLKVEDGLAVLDGDDTTCGETLSVPDAVDVVQDRCGGIAWTKEIGVQRVHPAVAVVDRS